MTTDNSTGTLNGSAYPAVAELIRFEVEAWYGSRHPDPEDRETLSAEAFERILSRVADRAYSAGRADPVIDRAGDFEECLHATRALVAGASFLHAEGDGNGVAHLLAIALAEIDRATECCHE